ncbi:MULTISPECIES: 50S ribosomal protein L15 [Nitrincola]|uniref:Large ribosomal subunit protein uL15 n=1 Tax=Nitrincola nitratireducens TaxID=1229521 RepID=W9VIB8_9GAMM|nr:MULTISPECIES: 50S ribosomal protein L15 [Nitrincola]EXJ10320.1 50S ribosomal protein L15 [Nitrincola nitratireducens]
MRLNTLRPGAGAKQAPKRVGRGIGSGLGKTCGRGHKGLKSRSGGSVNPGFEGGQMPIHRRLPKFGFTSRKSRYVAEVRLNELSSMNVELINIDALKAADVIKQEIKTVRIILSGEITKPVTLSGLKVTKGAQAAIEAAGGKVEA